MMYPNTGMEMPTSTPKTAPAAKKSSTGRALGTASLIAALAASAVGCKNDAPAQDITPVSTEVVNNPLQGQPVPTALATAAPTVAPVASATASATPSASASASADPAPAPTAEPTAEPAPVAPDTMMPVVPETFYTQYINDKETLPACIGLRKYIGTSVLVVIDPGNDNRVSLPCDENGTKWTVLNKACKDNYQNTSKNIESSVCTEDANGTVEVTITAPMTETDKEGKVKERKVTLRVRTDNKFQKVGVAGLQDDWAKNLNVIENFGKETTKVASADAEIYNAYPVDSKASRMAAVARGDSRPKTPGSTPRNTDTFRLEALETRTNNLEAHATATDVKIENHETRISNNEAAILRQKAQAAEMLSRLLAIKAAEDRANSGD